MAYSTSADVQAACGGAMRFIQFFDWDGDGIADSAEVTRYIGQADAFIDSFANRRFLVPFAVPVPPVVVTHSALLAKLYCKRARGVFTDDDRADLESAEEWCKAIGSGEALPGVDPLPSRGSIVYDRAVPRPNSKEISREKLKGFV